MTSLKTLRGKNADCLYLLRMDIHPVKYLAQGGASPFRKQILTKLKTDREWNKEKR
jgi:hypothetical protein